MDIVNAGIALFRSGEEKLRVSIGDLDKLYADLKSKGELDQSEQAQKVRELLNKTITEAQDAIQKTNANYSEVVGKLQVNYQNLIQQLEGSLPPNIKEKVEEAIAELKALLEKVQNK